MPRHNHTPKHTRFDPPNDAARKKRFTTKKDAERAISQLQKYNDDLQLSTYQSSLDGGWYLTSNDGPASHSLLNTV